MNYLNRIWAAAGFQATERKSSSNAQFIFGQDKGQGEFTTEQHGEAQLTELATYSWSEQRVIAL